MATKKQTAKYVDGFVFTISNKNEVAYKKMARDAAAVWKKFGALEYRECKGDDLKIKGPSGAPAPMSFNKLTKAKLSETVWFSFITYKNKTHRNQVNKKVMAYFSKKYADKMDMPMPFDMAKMAYGGFKVEVD